MQHIIEYRNEHTRKNKSGQPITYKEAMQGGKYTNLLCTYDENGNKLPLREASLEEVVTALSTAS